MLREDGVSTTSKLAEAGAGQGEGLENLAIRCCAWQSILGGLARLGLRSKWEVGKWSR